MNADFLVPIITISGIAVAGGYMLNAFGKSNDDKFDERQLIERGRGANLAMDIALLYLLGLFAGQALNLLRPEHWSIYAISGLVVTMVVYDCYCIFHDAWLGQSQMLGPTVLTGILFGVLWLVTALHRVAWDIETAWINGAFALCWLSRSVMLLLRTFVLYIRDRREDKGEHDGKER